MRKIALVAVAVITVCAGLSNRATADKLTPEMLSAMPCETADPSPVYSVNGDALDPAIQWYVWNKMEQFGLTKSERSELFPLWLAQIYQESRYIPTATNGRDWGLCQLRDTYHEYFIEVSGLGYQADLKTDTFANLYVGTWLYVDNYRRAGGDLEKAIKLYYNSGNADSDAKYYEAVKQWFSAINREN